jgi:hypothetical protein
MIPQLPKELDPKEPVETHEEEKEECDVVDLLGRPFEDLIDS